MEQISAEQGSMGNPQQNRPVRMRATKDGECSCGSEIKECHIRWEHLETVMHQPAPADRSPQDSTASAFPRYDRETGEFLLET